MAKRTTSVDRTILDPIFTIPEGAEDTFEYAEHPNDVFTDLEEEYDSNDASVFDDEVEQDYQDDGSSNDGDNQLETPTDFYVVLPQTLRRAPGGQQVVDIVLNIEDIVGASNYEVQVVKV